ncbi:MAG: hypothetical protein M1817_006210 [Caeruleum heppii]|nr:MAG: hypothetical protein M1817_006210 [Caeruleum heppii]
MPWRISKLLIWAWIIRQALSLAQDDLVRRDWLPNQLNRTLCWWEQPRSAVIRDTMYIDGGYLAYLPGFANGTFGAPERPEDGSVLYSINFTQPFEVSQNASDVLRTVRKTAGAANNLAPVYYDGMMFANDNEFYLYGGVLRDTDSLQPPPANQVLGYERYQYGPERASWEPGFYSGQLPEEMTRYITAGAGVNVPSENLGFYISGLRGAAWGEIRDQGRARYNASVIADTLISVDMSTMRREQWSNDSLPNSVPGRANAEVVWIPTASRGLLVAIGGVINPESAYSILSDDMKTESQDTSPGFMRTVSIYDVDSRTWYSQDTSGETPPQLTQFCSVVAAAKDGSSYNIYIYGGYDGLDETNAPLDDVYILSLPSFTWIKASTGTPAHGRRAHKCAKAYPDQMFVVGGQTQQLDAYRCLEGGLIQIFNLNTLEWQDRYDPNVWSEYKVPDIVASKIGGNADGAATSSSPASWGDDALSALFTERYTKTIPSYYPYASLVATPTDGSQPTRLSTSAPTPTTQSGGVPEWVGAVLGVVLGLVAITAILIGFLLYKRRKYIKRYGGSSSEAGSSSVRRNNIMAWMRDTPPSTTTKNAPSSSTDDPSCVSGSTALGSPHSEKSQFISSEPQEAPDGALHELPDNQAASELASVGLTHHVPQNSGSHGRARPPLPSTTSSSSSMSGAGIPRPESPTTSSSPTPGHRRQTSSQDISEPRQSPTPTGWARGHRRQVSSVSDGGTSAGGSEGRVSEDGAGTVSGNGYGNGHGRGLSTEERAPGHMATIPEPARGESAG